jgi:ABC-2 type transport system permease protein
MVLGIITIIKRNLRIYTNSKLSSTIFLLGPIVLILLFGATLQDTSLKNIDVGIFISQPDSVTESFLNGLREKSFNTINKNSLEECKRDVIDDKSQACIQLEKVSSQPEVVSENLGNYDVNLFVDFSKQRIVWGIIASIQDVVDKESDRVRESAINDLKDDAIKVKNEVSFVEYRLNLAISGIRQIEESLGTSAAQVTGQLQVTNAEINRVIDGLTTLRDNLDLLSDTYPQAIMYVEQLNNYIDDLNNSIQRVRGIETSYEDVRINSINQIISIRGDLERIKDSLNTLQNDLNQIESTNINRLASPVILNYKSVSDEGQGGSVERRLEFIDYLFPSFIMFFIVFSSIIFSSIIIMKERVSNSYVRNMVSSTSGFSFIAGNFITASILVIIQIAIISGIAMFFINLNVIGNLAPMIYILLISIFIFTLLGILIGYIFNSYDTSTIASISIALLLFVFSPAVTPAETLPPFIANIIRFSPLVLLETKLRITLIFNSLLKISLSEIVSLVSISVVSLILILGLYKNSKEKEI